MLNKFTCTYEGERVLASNHIYELGIRQKKIETKAADIQETRSIWYTNCDKLQICHHKKKKKIIGEACGEFFFSKKYLFSSSISTSKNSKIQGACDGKKLGKVNQRPTEDARYFFSF